MRGLSQSGMSVYRDCPYAYKLKYFNHVKPMFHDQSILDLGAIIHDSIDSYYKIHYLPEGTPEEILMETYDVLTKKWDISTFLPEQLKKAYVCLQHHAIFENSELKNGRKKPLSEVKLHHNGFFGFIDYIDPVKKLVIDYKSGKGPYLYYDNKVQAYVYKKLYEGEYNEELKEFSFFFLFSNIFTKVKYDSPAMLKVAEETEELKNNIIEATESKTFPKEPRTKNMCRNCKYNYYCQIEKL